MSDRGGEPLEPTPSTCYVRRVADPISKISR